jgi:hypothetical protein
VSAHQEEDLRGAARERPMPAFHLGCSIQ